MAERSDERGRTARSGRAVADGDCNRRRSWQRRSRGQGGDGHEGKNGRRCGQRRGMREAHAACVRFVRTRSGILRLPCYRTGIAERGPQGAGSAVAHHRGMGERLQEAERDREQRHRKANGLPGRLGALADHGCYYVASSVSPKGTVCHPSQPRPRRSGPFHRQPPAIGRRCCSTMPRRCG